MVLHSLAHALGWSGFYLMPKINTSSLKNHSGVHEITKHPKIKVNDQMYDAISLDTASQVTIFKQKYCVDKIFISKGNHCICSSDERELCSDSRCKIASSKCDHFLDDMSIRSILSLADATNRHMVTIDTRIDDAFCAHTFKGIAHYGRT